jgi:hypothetical protein
MFMAKVILRGVDKGSVDTQALVEAKNAIITALRLQVGSVLGVKLTELGTRVRQLQESSPAQDLSARSAPTPKRGLAQAVDEAMLPPKKRLLRQFQRNGLNWAFVSPFIYLREFSIIGL